MWSGEQEKNGVGESVLLLRPVDHHSGTNSRRNKNKNKGPKNNPSLSHVGGLPCYHKNDILISSAGSDDKYARPKCKRCDQPMYLLLALHAPLDDFDRTLYVFGCNDASCYSGGKGDSMKIRFQSCIGDAIEGGAMRCIRSQQPWKSSKTTSSVEKSISTNVSESPKESPANNLETNDWGLDDGSDGWGDEDDDDDWGGGGETNSTKDNANISMDDLEAMLTNSEMLSASKKSETVASTKLQSTSNSSSKVSGVNNSANAKSSQENVLPSPAFDHIDLEMLDEPPAGRGNADDSDDDDDDDGECATKVDQMLSKYLDMEEDEEILSALKGGGNGSAGKGDGGSGGNGGGGGGGERYERLPPEERAFLAFSNRLKRAPGQVARYVYGGVPLWSIPLPPSNAAKAQHTRSKQQQHKSKKKNSQKVYSPVPDVPKCVCGAARVFEIQILPSILHALDVDSYASTGAEQNDDDDVMDLFSSGGMNWGSVAVYSCSQSCDESRDEFLIVQEAVGDAPIEKKTEKNDDSGGEDMDSNTK